MDGPGLVEQARARREHDGIALVLGVVADDAFLQCSTNRQAQRFDALGHRLGQKGRDGKGGHDPIVPVDSTIPTVNHATSGDKYSFGVSDDSTRSDNDSMPGTRGATPDRMPRWIIKAVVVFWLGFLATILFRFVFNRMHELMLLLLVSIFIALAVEPGVNKLVRRGWRRGSATMSILMAVLTVLVLFVVAISTVVGRQVADLLSNSEKYVNDTVELINDTFNANIDADEVNERIRDPKGPVQNFIRNQRDNAFNLSIAALGVLLQLFSVLLFSFYLVADGPRMRRAICSRLKPEKQRTVLDTWELAIGKTGGYLYSRVLLAGLSALFHWVAFQALGIPAPIAMAMWVGLVSQFLPVIGTYLAGILPVLLTFINSPLKAVVVIVLIVVYQQIENYVFGPKITERTLELHPALAFGGAIAGGAILGPVGAILALPGVAMGQALISAWGDRHDVIDSPLTAVPPKKARGRRRGTDAS